MSERITMLEALADHLSRDELAAAANAMAQEILDSAAQMNTVTSFDTPSGVQTLRMLADIAQWLDDAHVRSVTECAEWLWQTEVRSRGDRQPDRDLVDSLATLIDRLPRTEPPALLPGLVVEVDEIRDSARRAQVMAQLALELARLGDRERAFDTIDKIVDERVRAETLVEVATRLGPDVGERAQAVAAQIGAELVRTRALVGLARVVPEGSLQTIVDEVRESGNVGALADVLITVSIRVGTAKAGHATREALRIIRQSLGFSTNTDGTEGIAPVGDSTAAGDAGVRPMGHSMPIGAANVAQLLKSLAPHIPTDKAEMMFLDVVAAAPMNARDILESLAKSMDCQAVERAATHVKQLADVNRPVRIDALAALTPHLRTR